MGEFTRYAVYYAPEPGAFATAAARWLGWDPALGQARQQPDLPVPLADWTAEPRRYGFHGTLKPPFRLAEGMTEAAFAEAVARLAASLRPVEMPGLDLAIIGSFMALVPQGDAAGLAGLAGEIVARLDGFRAPLTEAEIARRRPKTLSPRQRELLDRFGYPYVMEQYRFHLTVSGALPEADLARLRPIALAHFAPHLPRPFRVADLCLFGEAANGFHLVHRYPLTG